MLQGKYIDVPVPEEVKSFPISQDTQRSNYGNDRKHKGILLEKRCA